MALSELEMMNLWAKQLTGYKSQWERLFDFGYAIEAEIRKQLERPAPCQHQCEAQAFRIDKRSDTRLILQLVEALEKADKISGYPNNRKTITAGRARLVEGGQ